MKIRDRVKELRRVRAGDLRPSPRNWRTHPASQRDALQGILAEVGYADALLARELPDGSLELVDGHLRAETTPDENVPVLVLDVTEEEATKLLAVLDPLAAMAEADAGKLEALLREVQSDSEAVQSLLDSLSEDYGIAAEQPPPVDPEPQIDRAAELQKEWGTERSQLWIIPSKTAPPHCHRVMCGDSTKAEDVGRLMDEVRAGLMNTDPPYGIGFDNAALGPTRKQYADIANDELHNEQLQTFLEAAFRAAVDCALLPNAAWYMWHAHLTQGYFAAAAAAANVVLHRQIIWVKPRLILGRGHYHWKHEPCFMGWVKGHQPPDYGRGNGERDQVTTWEVDGVCKSDRDEYNHATPKPIGLFTIPITKHLKIGEACYEPFAGSGPQFVAAENLGRICMGLEIAPQYVAVILQRMKDMGLEPKLKD